MFIVPAVIIQSSQSPMKGWIQVRSTKKYNKDDFMKKMQTGLIFTGQKKVDEARLSFRYSFTQILDLMALMKDVRMKHHSEP